MQLTWANFGRHDPKSTEWMAVVAATLQIPRLLNHNVEPHVATVPSVFRCPGGGECT